MFFFTYQGARFVVFVSLFYLLMFGIFMKWIWTNLLSTFFQLIFYFFIFIFILYNWFLLAFSSGQDWNFWLFLWQRRRFFCWNIGGGLTLGQSYISTLEPWRFQQICNLAVAYRTSTIVHLLFFGFLTPFLQSLPSYQLLWQISQLGPRGFSPQLLKQCR